MFYILIMGFSGGSDGKKKKSTCNVGDPGSIPGSGRPHGEEHDNLLQYSCLENPQKQMSLMGCSLLQEGGRLPGPKSGLLSNIQKLIIQGDTFTDKARDFIGKWHPGREQ